MEAEAFRAFCLGKPAASEETPFGPEHLVFKVGGKMFVLLAFEEVPPSANLKYDPDHALELRDRYEDVTAGYHMNKKHWNSVIIAGAVPDVEIKKMIDESYNLVFRSLPKVEQARIAPPVP